MATKQQVTEYLDNQWQKGDSDAFVTYWEQPAATGYNATRLGLVANWISPEIAKILVKLVGETLMVKGIANNGDKHQ